jgi:hypothetical protein
MNEFSAKFKNVFLLVSCFYTNMISRNVWYVDNGASQHMISFRQLFSSLKKRDLGVHVSLVMMPSTQ